LTGCPSVSFPELGVEEVYKKGPAICDGSQG
jgi:hypothetical protein